MLTLRRRRLVLLHPPYRLPRWSLKASLSLWRLWSMKRMTHGMPCLARRVCIKCRPRSLQPKLSPSGPGAVAEGEAAEAGVADEDAEAGVAVRKGGAGVDEARGASAAEAAPGARAFT